MRSSAIYFSVIRNSKVESNSRGTLIVIFNRALSIGLTSCSSKAGSDSNDFKTFWIVSKKMSEELESPGTFDIAEIKF